MPQFPALPALPTLPAIPGYQTSPMVRRVSSLFPQRAAARQPHVAPIHKEGWWETLTGSVPPSNSELPAYGDLYPERAGSEEMSVKKMSAMQAAVDAAADLRFEQSDVPEAIVASAGQEGTSPSLALDLAHGGGRRETLELRRDRKLFFFWVSKNQLRARCSELC